MIHAHTGPRFQKGVLTYSNAILQKSYFGLFIKDVFQEGGGVTNDVTLYTGVSRILNVL